MHSAIDPELVSPTDLWTDISSKFLYILDPGSSRVIVYNKATGNLESQYTSPDFKNAIGFSIEETANRIVVVTSNQALGFTAEHLVKLGVLNRLQNRTDLTQIKKNAGTFPCAFLSHLCTSVVPFEICVNLLNFTSRSQSRQQLPAWPSCHQPQP